MRSIARWSLCVASAFFTFANAAHAADAAGCKPLQIVNTVKMEPIYGGAGELVPVAINGKLAKLLLDTGGGVSQLTHDAGKALGLQEGQSVVQSYDTYGHMSDRKVAAKTFDMGHLRWTDVTLQVSALPSFGNAEIAGVLSTDLYQEYDVDLDFGAQRLNYFSQDHCAGQVAYWPERPLAVISFSPEGGHINLPVTVDGHELRAILDTGAPGSVMSATVFQAVFGIAPGSPDALETKASASDPLMKQYSHSFGALTLDGITVSNPDIAIITDRVAADERKSTIRGTVSDPYGRGLSPMIIGMNMLRHLHVYVAYGEDKLYISPAGSGESALFRTAAPAPATPPAP